MKSWLQDNNTEMYSTYNEGKSVVAERYIRNITNHLQSFDLCITPNLERSTERLRK